MLCCEVAVWALQSVVQTFMVKAVRQLNEIESKYSLKDGETAAWPWEMNFLNPGVFYKSSFAHPKVSETTEGLHKPTG